MCAAHLRTSGIGVLVVRQSVSMANNKRGTRGTGNRRYGAQPTLSLCTAMQCCPSDSARATGAQQQRDPVPAGAAGHSQQLRAPWPGLQRQASMPLAQGPAPPSKWCLCLLCAHNSTCKAASCTYASPTLRARRPAS